MNLDHQRIFQADYHHIQQLPQLGFLDKKERNINKAEAGHFKNANTAPKSNLFEFKNFENELSVGDVLNVDHFSEGEFVDVSGTSKGKGFQGVVKRHGFAGVGQSTHGQHNSCLLYTSPSPRDRQKSRMPSSA